MAPKDVVFFMNTRTLRADLAAGARYWHRRTELLRRRMVNDTDGQVIVPGCQHSSASRHG
jgi:hypothetical protein